MDASSHCSKCGQLWVPVLVCGCPAKPLAQPLAYKDVPTEASNGTVTDARLYSEDVMLTQAAARRMYFEPEE